MPSPKIFIAVLSSRSVGNVALDVPKIFATSMGANISFPPQYRTKSPHRGVILLRNDEGVVPYGVTNTCSINWNLRLHRKFT